MHGTAPGHPLVREYLRDLDAALAALPVRQARELREQITSHLEEALLPGAGDEAVAETLHRLGLPGDLAAEAAAAAGKRPWPSRLGWRAWTLIAAVLVLASTVISYVAVVQSTGPLVAQGVAAWWYPQDYTRAVTTSANGQTQSTVPIRPGHRQGFVIELFNYTGLTQTVLGSTAADFVAPNGGTNIQIGGSTGPDHYMFHSLRYTLPVSIPPGQYRALRVLWTSRGCLPRASDSGTDVLTLQVRVGWITRTEVIELPQGFFLGPGKGPCP
jgi:HAAS